MMIYWSIYTLITVFSLELSRARGESAESCSREGNELDGYSYDCIGRGLSVIPKDFHKNTSYINLDFNNISEIRGDAFSMCENLRLLSLNNNKLSRIDAHAFSYNIELSRLDISHNRLTEISNGTLAPLKQLIYLTISNNQVQNFTDLTRMICETNKDYDYVDIDIDDGFTFHHSCSSMSSIRTLVLHTRKGKETSFRNESLYYFENTKIERIWLFGFATTKTLEANFLSPLHYVKEVKMDDFYISTSYALNRLIYPFQNQTLDSLDLRSIYTDRIEQLSYDALEYLPSICIKHLTLHDCRIQGIDFDMIRGSSLWYCLETFQFQQNYISTLTPIFIFTVALPNIIHIDICCQLVRKGLSDNTFDPLPRWSSGMRSERKELGLIELYLPNKTKYFSFSNNDLRIKFENDFLIHGNIEEIDFKYLRFSTCEGRILGLTKLKVLEIRQWNCEKMNPEFISHLSSITNLSIAQCNIGHNAKAFPIIYNLTNLTSLDIAENLIDDLNPIFFQSQVLSLKNLSLADNNLRVIPKAVFVLQNLKYLDLRLNLLSGISSDEMSFIDGLDDLIIFLGGNALRCSCETLPFMNWVRDNYNKIKDYDILTCKYNNVSEIKLEMAIRQLHQMEINCVSNIWLGLSISGLICLLLIVMVVFLFYKFQPDVRYVIARVKRFLRKMNRKASDVPILNHKQYHAYVSYGDTNYKWACKVLYKALKDEGFHLSLQHKDFEAGIPLSENILDAIDSSRRVIFVLSHDFLENEWDDFKIQIATYHAIRKKTQNFIIVILLDAIQLHEIPESLQRIWIRVKCLRWPQCDEQNSILSFWEELRNELTMD